MTIVGVYFDHNGAKLSYWERGGLYTLSLNLTQDLLKNVLNDEGCFQRVFTQIIFYLQSEKSFYDVSFVIGVPDSFGLMEKERLFQYANRGRIRISRLVSRTSAAAIAFSWQKDIYDVFWFVYDDGKNIEIGEYSIDSKIIEKENVYLLDDYKGKLVYVDCKNSQNGIAPELPLPDHIIYIEDNGLYSTFYSSVCEKRIPDRLPSVSILSADYIITGLGIYSGKLGGNTEKGEYIIDTLLVDLFSSYQTCFSINQDMYDLFPIDMIVPTKKTFRIQKQVSLSKEMTVNVLERRSNRYIRQFGIDLDANELSSLNRSDFFIIFEGGVDGAITITISDENGFSIAYTTRGE